MGITRHAWTFTYETAAKFQWVANCLRRNAFLARLSNGSAPRELACDSCRSWRKQKAPDSASCFRSALPSRYRHIQLG